MTWTHYSRFYGDIEPTASVEDVEKCIVNGGIDPDGIGRSEWVRALSTDDLPFYLYTHILKHKDEPAIKPLYDYLYTEISGILDKE